LQKDFLPILGSGGYRPPSELFWPFSKENFQMKDFKYAVQFFIFEWPLMAFCVCIEWLKSVRQKMLGSRPCLWLNWLVYYFQKILPSISPFSTVFVHQSNSSTLWVSHFSLKPKCVLTFVSSTQSHPQQNFSSACSKPQSPTRLTKIFSNNKSLCKLKVAIVLFNADFGSECT
jgi:hypothetical protein